jgi:quercetin dioxygenase-like cupin family protein
MKPILTALDPVTSPSTSKTILSKDGFTGSLIMLAPGETTPREDSAHREEHLLFLVDGQVTVHFDDTHTILGKDQAMLIPKGKKHSLAAHPEGGTKLLRLEVPPRKVVEPEIHSFAL